MLLRFKGFMMFLKRHGREVWQEVRSSYIETLSKVLSSHFKAYLTAIQKLQVCVQSSLHLLSPQIQRTRFVWRISMQIRSNQVLAGDICSRTPVSMFSSRHSHIVSVFDCYFWIMYRAYSCAWEWHADCTYDGSRQAISGLHWVIEL